MEINHLIQVFGDEGRLLHRALRETPSLRPLFTREFAGVDLAALRLAYARLLKMTADYVQHTTPALRAAARRLAAGDHHDQNWGARISEYAAGETDEVQGYGHQAWAHADMRGIEAPSEITEAPPHQGAVSYGKYFVERAAQHPYAILGAKGVLEHLAILASDDIVQGILDSGIPNAEKAVSFFRRHGVLDVEHVRQGNLNLATLRLEGCEQALAGAYVTSGAYRTMLAGIAF